MIISQAFKIIVRDSHKAHCCIIQREYSTRIKLKYRGFKAACTRANFWQCYWKIFTRKNLSRSVVTHMRRDKRATIAFGKNLRCVSNTFDLQCRFYFVQLDARIILARDHLHETDFNVWRIPGQSRVCVNSKSYAI